MAMRPAATGKRRKLWAISTGILCSTLSKATVSLTPEGCLLLVAQDYTLALDKYPARIIFAEFVALFGPAVRNFPVFNAR
jgi:hypothetical protein